MYLPPKSLLATMNADYRIRTYQLLKSRLLETEHGKMAFGQYEKTPDKENRLSGLIDHLDKPEISALFNGGWKNELGVVE